MINEFGYLGESRTAIAIICPVCKSSKAISKESFSDYNSGIMNTTNTCTCGYKSCNVDMNYIKETNKRVDKIYAWIAFPGILLFLAGLICCFTTKYDGEVQAVVGVIALLSGIVMFFSSLSISDKFKVDDRACNVLNKYFKQEKEDDTLRKDEILNETIKLNEIPNDKKVVTIKNKTNSLMPGNWCIWVTDKVLNLFPVIEASEINVSELLKLVNKQTRIKLNMDKIEYFYFQGEVFRENKITGGGGGGVSVGDAIVGGVIAGGAGAIIAGRKKIDPIRSELVTHDTREAYINYFNNSGERKSIFFEYKDYQTLLDIIPQKEYSIVASLKTNNTIASLQNEEKSKTVTEQIREISKLKDEGILTEEEFSVKKKLLLEKIK